MFTYGTEPYFKGTYIAGNNEDGTPRWTEPKYPVLRLDFSRLDVSSLEVFRKDFLVLINEQCQKLGIEGAFLYKLVPIVGKIMESEIGKPAAAPAPVPADRIDEQRDHRGVHAVRLEIGALSHRTGDDRRRRRAEHRLENDVAPERHGLRNNAVLGGVAAVDEEVRRADESAESAVEHQREADEPETGSTDAEVHHILHQNISRVLGSRQACLTECKSGLHEVDQS